MHDGAVGTPVAVYSRSRALVAAISRPIASSGARREPPRGRSPPASALAGRGASPASWSASPHGRGRRRRSRRRRTCRFERSAVVASEAFSAWSRAATRSGRPLHQAAATRASKRLVSSTARLASSLLAAPSTPSPTRSAWKQIGDPMRRPPGVARVSNARLRLGDAVDLGVVEVDAMRIPRRPRSAQVFHQLHRPLPKRSMQNCSSSASPPDAYAGGLRAARECSRVTHQLRRHRGAAGRHRDRHIEPGCGSWRARSFPACRQG